ncbi:MAG: metal-sensing transcriptional repressor [Faecalibacillus faecis]
MVEEDRYCIDISHQIMASEAILKRANKEVLKAHMTHCVHDAVNSEDCDQKIEEMIKVLDNLLKYENGQIARFTRYRRHN